MRFTSLVTALVLAAATLSSAAVTRGIVGTSTVNDGNNRPSITGVLSVNAPIAVAAGDTLMFGSARDSVNALSASYKTWPTTTFNTKIPKIYQGVASNKDSIRVCVTGVGEADTTAMTTVLQVNIAPPDSTRTYVALGSATLSFLSTARTRECANFINPGLLDFRVRNIGAGSTDTTDVSRFEIYDK